MNGFAVPVMHQCGLWPAPVKGTKNPISPLTITTDLDKRGVRKGVTMFHFHMHLPHDALTTDDATSMHVLARQLIDLSRPHPFHGGGQPGVQCVHQHAAEGHTRRPYPDGRLDSLHHGVWWHWM
jgi:hypothetical protein